MRTATEVIDNRASSHRVVPAGHEIYAEGEICNAFFYVVDGWAIQHQILEDGRRQILDFALPGNLLGFNSGPDSQMSHTAECLVDTTVAVIPKTQLAALLQHDPAFAAEFATRASETLNSAYETLTDIGRRTAREAVAHLLLRLFLRVRAAGTSTSAGAVEFPLTLEHIGDALGLTGVHVCRTLRSLREDGILHLARGTLCIFDLMRLVEAAGCSSDQFVGSRPIKTRSGVPGTRRGITRSETWREEMRLAS